MNRRYFTVDGVDLYDCDTPGCPCNEAEPPIDRIDQCECGHLSIDHVRVVFAAFVCSSCSCSDHAPVIPDDETVADIQLLLAS